VSIRESEYDVLGGTLIGIGPLVSDWELSSASWIRQLLSRIVARRPTVICSLSLSLSLSLSVCVFASYGCSHRHDAAQIVGLRYNTSRKL
jgi:hypothetical protein